MKKISEIEHNPDMLDEYDLKLLKGARNKYAGRPVTHSFTIELKEKADGTWLASIVAFDVQATEQTREKAISKVQGLAFRVLADRLEQGKSVFGPSTISFLVSE